MVISGNQKVARVTESGRGMGVEVTERDHDENRERDGGRDQPCRPITTRQRLNLHQRCRTRGVSSPRASIYTPSHTSSYSPVPDKSLHINHISTQYALPHVKRKVRGGGRGATLPKTCGFRTRQVFLRHTRRAGSLPMKSSLREGSRTVSMARPSVSRATVGSWRGSTGVEGGAGGFTAPRSPGNAVTAPPARSGSAPVTRTRMRVSRTAAAKYWRLFTAGNRWMCYYWESCERRWESTCRRRPLSDGFSILPLSGASTDWPVRVDHARYRYGRQAPLRSIRQRGLT